MKKVNYISSVAFLIIWLLFASGFIFFGFNRVNSGISSIQDNFTKHYANVGLLYLKLGIISGTILIFLLVLFLVSIIYKNKQ